MWINTAVRICGLLEKQRDVPIVTLECKKQSILLQKEKILSCVVKVNFNQKNATYLHKYV